MESLNETFTKLHDAFGTMLLLSDFSKSENLLKATRK